MSDPGHLKVREKSLAHISPTMNKARRLTRVQQGFKCMIQVQLTLNTNLNTFPCHKYYTSKKLLKSACPDFQLHDTGFCCDLYSSAAQKPSPALPTMCSQAFQSAAY